MRSGDFAFLSLAFFIVTLTISFVNYVQGEAIGDLRREVRTLQGECRP